jgi:hypothetical protein
VNLLLRTAYLLRLREARIKNDFRHFALIFVNVRPASIASERFEMSKLLSQRRGSQVLFVISVALIAAPSPPADVERLS